MTGRDPIEGLPRKEGRGWRTYVLGVAIFILAIFIIQNAQKVTVDFLFVETETPLIFALLFAGALGRADRLGLAARSPQPPPRARARRARLERPAVQLSFESRPSSATRTPRGARAVPDGRRLAGG